VIAIVRSTDTAKVDALLAPRRERDRALLRRVSRIVEDVRLGGDAALRTYAERFDRLEGPLEVPAAAIAEGARRAPRPLRAAIRTAARNIARVARAQLPRGQRVTVGPGITVEQRVRPLDRVGCYVPGGRYPLPSSLLMAAVPARVAGRARGHRRLPEAGCGRALRRARGRGDAAVPARGRTRSRRSRSARRPFRVSTRSSVQATSTLRPPRHTCRRSARSISRRARARS
jgi:hypothetical protein